VAKDKKGTVSEAEAAPSARWAKVVFAKGAAFTATPDANDGEVYTDEFVAFMAGKYGPATAKDGVKHWEVDNEPGLWPSTHPRIHPAKPTCDELIQKTTALATAVKQVDPQAEIFGGVFYGYNDYASLQDAPDWKTLNASGKYAWYIDYFLEGMQKNSDKAGKRLMDVLDLHWYSEAKGDHRINDTAAHTEKDRMARLQAPRSLWDDTYAEDSWISQWATPKQPVTDWNNPTPGPILLLPRIQASIGKYYPGTRIAITEYNYGEADHVTGGLANADFLGTAAAAGVYAADFWQLNEKPVYVASAFRLFRNYDGKKGAYGSMAAQASASDRNAASVFASYDPGGDEIHIVAINKSPTDAIQGSFTVTSPAAVAGAKAWGFDKSGPALSAKADAAVSGNAFAYTLPPWSATHFVLKTNCALPATLKTAAPRAPSPDRRAAYLPDGRVLAPAGTGRHTPNLPRFVRP
jgi:mannan endo-1,4-beta-mannosidase